MISTGACSATAAMAPIKMIGRQLTMRHTAWTRRKSLGITADHGNPLISGLTAWTRQTMGKTLGRPNLTIRQGLSAGLPDRAPKYQPLSTPLLAAAPTGTAI